MFGTIGVRYMTVVKTCQRDIDSSDEQAQ